MNIKVKLYFGFWTGDYWLEKIERTEHGNPRIIAHFSPIDCRASEQEAVTALDWLVDNRIDCQGYEVHVTP